MKNYNLVPQENNKYCICSVLQAILKGHGINISQEEITDNLTPAKYGFIANDERIKDFLRSRGFEYSFYWHNETPFNEPDNVLRKMHENEGIIGINSHIYLLRDFNDPKLEMINPENNTIVKRDIYQLLRDMEKHEGFFGIIKRLENIF